MRECESQMIVFLLSRFFIVADRDPHSTIRSKRSNQGVKSIPKNVQIKANFVGTLIQVN